MTTSASSRKPPLTLSRCLLSSPLPLIVSCGPLACSLSSSLTILLGALQHFGSLLPQDICTCCLSSPFLAPPVHIPCHLPAYPGDKCHHPTLPELPSCPRALLTWSSCSSFLWPVMYLLCYSFSTREQRFLPVFVPHAQHRVSTPGAPPVNGLRNFSATVERGLGVSREDP